MIRLITDYWPLLPTAAAIIFWALYKVKASKSRELEEQARVVVSEKELLERRADRERNLVLELTNDQRKQRAEEAAKISDAADAAEFLRDSLRNRN